MRSFLILIVLYIGSYGFIKAINKPKVLFLKTLPTQTYRLGKTNLFNQIYLESGVKFSNNADTVGNLVSNLFGLQHALSKKITLFHALNYISQENIWGNVNQQSYYAFLEYKLNSKVKFGFSYSYLLNKTKYISGLNTDVYNNNNHWLGLSGTFNVKKFFIKPLLAFSRLHNFTILGNQVQAGAEFVYDFNRNEKLLFGLGSYYFYNNGSAYLLAKPSLAIQLNDDLQLSADYFYTNTKNFSDQDGYVIYNSIDKTIDRSTVTFKYEFINNAFLYAIYQFERKQNHQGLVNYNFNSIFLGIKYNL